MKPGNIYKIKTGDWWAIITYEQAAKQLQKGDLFIVLRSDNSYSCIVLSKFGIVTISNGIPRASALFEM
jgi:hypothetical protein